MFQKESFIEINQINQRFLFSKNDEKSRWKKGLLRDVWCKFEDDFLLKSGNPVDGQWF